MLEAAGASEVMSGLVLDGIIGGVGAVLGFVPQICLLFLFLSFLEDCGYMARVAFIMDRIFRQFGLSRQVVYSDVDRYRLQCSGIMAARTIENERDRKLTIMLTPFIPCNAKLPVFALFAAAFFPEQSWVGPSMYLWGIVMVVFSGILLKKTRAFAGEPANFVMELPAYHWPRVKDILIILGNVPAALLLKPVR